MQPLLDDLCRGIEPEDLSAALQGLLASSADTRAAALAALPHVPFLSSGEAPEAINEVGPCGWAWAIGINLPYKPFNTCSEWRVLNSYLLISLHDLPHSTKVPPVFCLCFVQAIVPQTLEQTRCSTLHVMM